jgi:His-Xaa-Ser system protein HxsD
MVDAVRVEFDAAVQSLDALNAAAYRLLDTTSCQIEKSGGKFVCFLTPKSSSQERGELLRLHFLDCVTDENLRESLAKKTEPVRNLILSLAFGALASKQDDRAG